MVSRAIDVYPDDIANDRRKVIYEQRHGLL